MTPEDITLLSLLAERKEPAHLYYFWEQAEFHNATALNNVDIRERLKSLIEAGYVEVAVDRGYDSLYTITEAGRAAL